jgi:poly(A) polymerase
MRRSTLRRLMARPTFADELELHRVDCLGSNGLLDNHVFLLAKQAEFASEPLLPAWLLTGADLIAAGWSPGPELGRTLTAVQNAQLEGLVSTREEALAWLARQSA